jgi:hypothetical protein
MCITGIVENDTIKLPAGVHLPEETAVDPRHAWMLEFVGIANDLPTKSGRSTELGDALAGLAPFVGKITTLPADFAERHDESIHGRNRSL